MKKTLLTFLLLLTFFLVGCNNSSDANLPMFNTDKVITIYGNADDNVVTYYANATFNQSGTYVLELSVLIPNDDGTSVVEIIKSKEFKVKKEANLLVDGILVSDVKKLLQDKTTKNFKELEYSVNIYEGTTEKKGNGMGTTWKLYKDVVSE